MHYSVLSFKQFSLSLFLACLCGLPILAQQPIPSPQSLPGASQPAWVTATPPHIRFHSWHPSHVFELFPLNITVFRQINMRHHRALDAFFLVSRYLGNGLILLPVLGLLIAFRRKKITPLLIALVIETALVTLLKETTHQPRPGLVLPDVHLLLQLYRHSFPSGDTAMAFTVAMVLVQGERRAVQVLLLLLACLVAYGRIYLGVHFPLDVCVGMLIGVLSAWLAHALVRRRTPRAATTAATPQAPALE